MRDVGENKSKWIQDVRRQIIFEMLRGDPELRKWVRGMVNGLMEVYLAPFKTRGPTHS